MTSRDADKAFDIIINGTTFRVPNARPKAS